VRTSSVFVSESGEWRLGGFELVSKPSDDSAVLYVRLEILSFCIYLIFLLQSSQSLAHLIPDADTTAPPEVKKNGWQSLKDLHVAAPDGYGLGLLMFQLFNPDAPYPQTIFPPHPQPLSSDRGTMPAPLFALFKRLINPSPKARLRAKELFDLGMGTTVGEHTGFFSRNKLVKICESLDGFALMGEEERLAFLR
jgi:SCY1-like protein 1